MIGTAIFYSIYIIMCFFVCLFSYAFYKICKFNKLRRAIIFKDHIDSVNAITDNKTSMLQVLELEGYPYTITQNEYYDGYIIWLYFKETKKGVVFKKYVFDDETLILKKHITEVCDKNHNHLNFHQND